MRTCGFLATTICALSIAANAGAATVSKAAPGTVVNPAAIAPFTKPLPSTVFGMNLGVPSFYSNEVAYTELFKNNADFTFNGQQSLPGLLDVAGRPGNVPAGTSLWLGVDFSQKKWRSGVYDCQVSDGWAVSTVYRGTGGTVAQSGTSFTLTIPDTVTPGLQIILTFTSTKKGASLNTLSCKPRGSNPQVEPLTTGFRQDMQPFGVIRFMDWMKTNGLGPQTWANRPLPNDISMVPRGAAVEDMVDVANRLGSDPWFTLPFDADEAYYRNFAIYVRDHLAVGRKAYVEFSNEVWNPGFQQGRDAITRGHAIYGNGLDFDVSDLYYADRVKALMTIWTDVFAGQTFRIVRVASTQLFAPNRAQTILSHNDTYKVIDAVAGAPYFGTIMDELPGTGAARVNAYFAQLPSQIYENVNIAKQLKAIADKYDIRMITYEGGPNMVGYSSQAAADVGTVLYDQRLYDAYTSFLQQWQQQIGDVMVLFDSVGAGYFSHKEYTGQPTAQTQKMRAIVDFQANMPAPPQGTLKWRPILQSIVAPLLKAGR